jgi:putative glutamine amidotransferase
MGKRVLIPFRHASKVEPYADAALAAGADPAPRTVTEPIALDGFDGLLLMGGTDVNPVRYGEQSQPETDEPDDVRDEAELELIRQAIQKDLPILAICRGLQILNVYHGGTLIQHLASSARHDIDAAHKGEAAHAVAIVSGSVLHRVAGAEEWPVNSRHHQAANRVGRGLLIAARDSDDGTVEALERPDRRFVLAVQWHTEDQVKSFPEQRRLFEQFVTAL